MHEVDHSPGIVRSLCETGDIATLVTRIDIDRITLRVKQRENCVQDRTLLNVEERFIIRSGGIRINPEILEPPRLRFTGWNTRRCRKLRKVHFPHVAIAAIVKKTLFHGLHDTVYFFTEECAFLAQFRLCIGRSQPHDPVEVGDHVNIDLAALV